MFRQLLALGALGALLSSGCVVVTEPICDIEKAEPDKDLVGTWSVTDTSAHLKPLEIKSIAVDMPEVKGNPKGLMRVVGEGSRSRFVTWFVTTTIGKHSYVCMITARSEPAFDKEGNYAKWLKSDGKVFDIFRYARDGDKLTLDVGNEIAVEKLMRDEKIGQRSLLGWEPYPTPPGWLAKYLDKAGPEKLFDGTNCLKLEREKK